MADNLRLTVPRVRIVRADQDDIEVQCINADLVLWDRTRHKHKWPTFQDAPFLWLTFLSWAACRRAQVIPSDLSYEAYEATVLEVEALNDDDDDDTGSPIPSAAVPD